MLLKKVKIYMGQIELINYLLIIFISYLTSYNCAQIICRYLNTW